MADRIHWFYLFPNIICQILTQEYEKDIFQCQNINRQRDAKKRFIFHKFQNSKKKLGAGEVGSPQGFIRAVERKQRKNLTGQRLPLPVSPSGIAYEVKVAPTRIHQQPEVLIYTKMCDKMSPD